MPATALNFLNGVDGSSIFDFVKQQQQNQQHHPQFTTSTGANAGGQDDLEAGFADDFEGEDPEEDGATAGGTSSYDNVYVELGCKVYEINKVYYTNSK